MANKITQLVNESGDNLYPLAGGMASDSITTAMLKDASVTSDKIDWTTIQTIDLSSYIDTTVVSTVGRAYAITFGKIVCLNITLNTVSLTAGGTYTLFSGLPAALRPSVTTNIAGALGTKPMARAWIGSNGVIQFTNWEGATTPNVNIGAMYIAN